MARPTPSATTTASGAIPRGMKRTRRGKLRKRSLLWRLRRVLVMLVVIGIVSVSGGAYWVWATTDLPDKVPPLLQTTFMCAADVQTDCNQDNAMYQIVSGVDRVTVTYEQIPPIVIQALISAEDKDFFRHQGVDPNGVARALYSDLRTDKGLQGGSTLTQQYVKTTYLSDELTVTRKLKEAVLAIKLDRELPKQEILERYLNTVYFGRGAYGIGAAARVYFGKHVEELGLPEAAYLAGIIRQPESLDANRQETDPLRARQQIDAKDRRHQVLSAMADEGYITAEASDATAALGWDYVLVREPAKARGTVKRPELGTQYFIDYVQRWLVKSGIVDDGQLAGGGLRIYTTLDYNAQQAAYDAVGSFLNQPDDPSASIVSIDEQGLVRAMVGGSDYGKLQVNLAIGAEACAGCGRQPGSSFKPFVLAAYLAEGKSLNNTYEAPGKLDVKFPDGQVYKNVINYENVEEGRLNVVDATRLSSNTAYVQIERDTGIAASADMAKKLGVTSTLDQVPSMVLGTSQVSVLDMASAYSTFAQDGDHFGPYVVSKVTNAQGQVLWSAPTTGVHVLDPEVAKTVNWVLSQVVESGTGANAKYGQSVAGKTGTTDDYHDAWFVGYTCKLTTAVWMGYPGEPGKPAEYMTNFRHVGKVAGGTVPTMIFQKYMSRATANMQSCPFDKPAGVNASVGTPAPAVGQPTGPAAATSSAPGPTTAGPTTTAAAGPTITVPAPTSTIGPVPTTVIPVPTTVGQPPTTIP